jgi:hypothetical protein
MDANRANGYRHIGAFHAIDRARKKKKKHKSQQSLPVYLSTF